MKFEVTNDWRDYASLITLLHWGLLPLDCQPSLSKLLASMRQYTEWLPEEGGNTEAVAAATRIMRRVKVVRPALFDAGPSK
jgi:hypothetical protein